MNDADLDYLRNCLDRAPFTPYSWDGEDKNLRAFRSKEELVAWYCQPPGEGGEPYRDRGFYCRELAYLSRTVRPRSIVEFGTSLGIGTCLLHWLNPLARIVTVDVATETHMPGDRRVQVGELSRHQNIPCGYVVMKSWEYQPVNVDLYFIDGDHSHDAVLRDSCAAWRGRSVDRPWAIAWHDYNDRHSGVVDAVNWFCWRMRVNLQSRPDSDTVWIMGKR